MNFWIVKCSESANDEGGWSWDWYFRNDAYPSRDEEFVAYPTWLGMAAMTLKGRAITACFELRQAVRQLHSTRR